MPNLFVPSIEQAGDEVREALSAAFDEALDALDAMRLREGLALGDDIVGRLVTVRKLAKSVTERAPQVVEQYKRKLKERAERPACRERHRGRPRAPSSRRSRSSPTASDI